MPSGVANPPGPLYPPQPQLPVLDKEGASRCSSGLPTFLQVPGQREPDRQSVAVELGAGLVALVGAVLQEGVLVAVQVVHQVPVAAVLGDDVDGPCGGTGSGTVPREALASVKGHESNDRLPVGEAA